MSSCETGLGEKARRIPGKGKKNGQFNSRSQTGGYPHNGIQSIPKETLCERASTTHSRQVNRTLPPPFHLQTST
ncbi:40S ribosomal protein S26E [Penicillium desertorum]|uniref:40S ribosomal protein S26E n=1 Tax=Penicillium desertorum TaxID=1303715 RepID=A0A9X0BWW0_9EURO|nr:40S ribosomal protein S26E [Penicillium desertorum]